jgi:transcriptional regulator with XRE-family HTH domain
MGVQAMSPGRRVRLERVRLGWTQAQLAERAGLLSEPNKTVKRVT